MQSKTSHTAHTGSGHYHHLALMVGLSFLAMYALMYAMVDRFANVFSNLKSTVSLERRRIRQWFWRLRRHRARTFGA